MTALAGLGGTFVFFSKKPFLVFIIFAVGYISSYRKFLKCKFQKKHKQIIII